MNYNKQATDFLQSTNTEMKIENFESNRGNKVANQLIIHDDNGNVIFQSYNSVIAIKDGNGNITLDEKYWDYSATTGNYRNQFLGESKKETEAKIKLGVYKLANLNQ